MILCLDLPEIDTALVLDVCTALARYNARTWTCRRDERCLAPPWKIRYAAPKLAARVVLRDAITLHRVGVGACGELASAYAGFLLAQGERPTIESAITAVTPEGEPTWHVWVRNRDKILDPAVLGTA